MQIEKIIVIGDNSRQAIGKLTEAVASMGKVLICDDKSFVKKTTQYKIERMNIEMLMPLEDIRCNFHDKFREFGISKREMLKPMKICRKK